MRCLILKLCKLLLIGLKGDVLDALSRLLALYPVRVALDYRCHFGAPWRMDEASVAAGVAPYHLIVEGMAWLDTVEQKDIQLQAGDIVVLPHGSAHCLRTGGDALAQPVRGATSPSQVLPVKINDGAGPATDILCGQFRFDPAAAGVFLTALPPLILLRSAGRPDMAGMRTLIAMLRGEIEAERAGAGTVIAQLASALFAMVIRAWIEQADSVPGMFALLAEPRLRNALQAMLAEPARSWSVEQLASACHMSRATFARRFRECAAATPGEMLMRTRMAQAAQWLARDPRSVAAIGEAAGYRSEAAFSRAFTRFFGMGPGQYRRSQRQAVPDLNPGFQAT
jgi:AraC family transcriptional activator of mtrCDE